MSLICYLTFEIEVLQMRKIFLQFTISKTFTYHVYNSYIERNRVSMKEKFMQIINQVELQYEKKFY